MRVSPADRRPRLALAAGHGAPPLLLMPTPGQRRCSWGEDSDTCCNVDSDTCCNANSDPCCNIVSRVWQVPVCTVFLGVAGTVALLLGGVPPAAAGPVVPLHPPSPLQ